MRKIISFLIFFLFPFTVYPSPSDLKLGYEAFVKKDYANAVSFLRQASIPKGSPLHDYYLWALGRSYFEQARFEESIRPLEELVRQEPESLFYKPALGTLALAFQQKGENEKTKKWVNENLSRMNDAAKGEALYALALAEQALGQKEAALKFFKEVFVQYPFVDGADLAEIQLQKEGVFLSAEDYVKRGDRLLQNKNYASALKAYDTAGPQANSLSKGKALYFLKRYREAAVHLSTLPPTPSPRGRGIQGEGAELLYYLGMSYDKSGQDTLAKQTFLELHQKFPGSPEAAEGLQLIVKMELTTGRLSEAQNIAKILSQNYPGGNYRDRALWAVSWKAYQQRDWGNAKFFFEELSKGKTDFPTQAKGLYWLARVYQNEGNSQKAQEYFSQAIERAPLSYYSFMALKKVKNSGEISDTPPVPASWKNFSAPLLKSTVNSSEDKMLVWNYHWLKAEALYAANLGKYAGAELLAALDQNSNHPESLFRILEASKKTDAYFIPVLLAGRYWERVKEIFADLREAETYRNSFQFPFAFRRQVQEAAREFSLSPYLIMGLMRQESAFQPWIVSSANAQGLMQLLPATARARARASGIAMGDLFDPEKNIELGSAELSALFNRFGGNWIYALAGYNAGPGRPPQWAAQFGHLPTDEFIEEIPLSETNLYVKLVLRNYWTYRTLYK